jgi:hypothetical protein
LVFLTILILWVNAGVLWSLAPLLPFIHQKMHSRVSDGVTLLL